MPRLLAGIRTFPRRGPAADVRIRFIGPDSETNRMRRTVLVPAFCALLAVVPAAAQQTKRLPTTRQFPTVHLRRPAPPDDAGFAAFRSTLAAIVRRRSFADLAGVVMAQGFF